MVEILYFSVAQPVSPDTYPLAPSPLPQNLCNSMSHVNPLPPPPLFRTYWMVPIERYLFANFQVKQSSDE